MSFTYTRRPDAITMSVDEAAQQLGISRSHAYDLIRAQHLPHLRLGRRIVIPRRELEAWITRHACPGEPGDPDG